MKWNWSENKLHIYVEQWRWRNSFLFYYHKSSELSFLIKKMSWLCWETIAEIQHPGDICLLLAFWRRRRGCQTGKLKCWRCARHFEASIKRLHQTLTSFLMHFASLQSHVSLCFVFSCKSQNNSNEISEKFSLHHISVRRNITMQANCCCSSYWFVWSGKSLSSVNQSVRNIFSSTDLISLCINQSAVESNKRKFKLLISTS